MPRQHVARLGGRRKVRVAGTMDGEPWPVARCWSTFHTALEQWRGAADMPAFCDALEQAAGRPSSQGKLAAWLSWARARANKIDPTVGTPTLSMVDFIIEPSREALRPHLNGWSPYRPAKE